ncbi:cysteine proteinase [Stylonychia lemnae]|uniref:Cysteine proteinase n=1 Tax=Stylonychia lemnae TaxID=5949 RepID=A0A077ZYU2_STYLE|nr:cysteine proteinase [Stylonychia lemnae]|eukprot:CDW75080.1 cysteine proteinase [Stylonychia lemnae]
MANYLENYQKILKFNGKQKSVKLSLNRFADLSNEEFKKIYLNRFNSKQVQTITDPLISIGKIRKSQQIADNDNPSLDWRELGKVTSVKDQGDCGSCYAFAALSTLESALLIQNEDQYKGIDLSEQQIIDCSFRNGGCNGGHETIVFQYLMTQDITREIDYPYIQRRSQCKQNLNDFVRVRGFYNSKEVDASVLKYVIQNQPVSIGVSGYSDVFRMYKSGIISSDCGEDINHAVQLVGYGRENGMNYWIIKNSWGETWGENGYARILMTENTTTQTCGIGSDYTYPVLF